MFFIDHQIPTGQVVSVAGQTGEFAPLHCTAHGKALLADYDLSALRDLLGRTPLQVYTRTTVKSVTRLARVCAQVRADGFAFDDGEYIAEVRCVAAPIRDPQGEIVASVGISSPVSAAAGPRHRPRRGRSEEDGPRHQRVTRGLTESDQTSSYSTTG